MATRVPCIKVSPKQQELGDKEVGGRIHTEQWDYLVTPGFKFLFVYFWVCWVFIDACGFFLVTES